MKDLSGKTALITGASRGIGAAIFEAFGSAGAKVIGTATGDAGLKAINQAGAAFAGTGMQYNAQQASQTPDLIAQLSAQGSEADILVINAGVNADGLLLRLKAEQWHTVLEVNLTAAFLLSQSAVRTMIKKRWGRIIFISSVVASLGNPGQANYCAAKAGMEGYCRAMAREVASRGITVNAIAPGFIETDMTNQLPDAVREKFVSNIPLGRAGSPQEVAAAALYLAGDGGAYVTGQVLHVNGGMYMG